mmetsp:Transcript_30256/g.76129  ORF Transcript_30256/g.76129 Transcript_30256/m.76129 type:complete len:445 (+) Transcript_30256:94-1428(+)
MVQIDEKLLRGRAEHNDCCLSTLKEVSLHQQNIEGINRALTRLCPELQILYLQHNLIAKIENMRRLKELDYLNMAINNITKIEGLERNEKLRKLDLTVNFIDLDGLLGVEKLKVNLCLEELYLLGNPCCEYDGYRLFVVGTLPQVKKLDGNQVTASERILAQQGLKELRERLVVAAKERVRQKGGNVDLVDAAEVEEQVVDSDDERELYGWSPEIRLADYKKDIKREEKRAEEQKRIDRERDPVKAAEEEARANRTLFKEDGTPRQCNDGKWQYKMDEDKEGNIKVDIDLPKFMDSSLLDLDVQPKYFRITVKKPEKHDKILQLIFPSEVRSDECQAQRSQTTGNLVLLVPKLHWTKPLVDEDGARRRPGASDKIPTLEGKGKASGGGPTGAVNIRNMARESPNAVAGGVDIRPVLSTAPGASKVGDADDESDFEDDPDCPPLE